MVAGWFPAWAQAGCNSFSPWQGHIIGFFLLYPATNFHKTQRNSRPWRCVKIFF